MKKKIPIVLILLALLGICMRSGLMGGIYRSVTGDTEELSLSIAKRYDASDAPYGEIYPAFQAKNVGDKTITAFSGSGRIANISTKEREKYVRTHYDSLYSITKGHGDSLFWWLLDAGDSYSVFVKTSRFGIVLQQKKIVFSQTPPCGYDARVEKGWDPFDIPLLLCVVLLLSGIFLLRLQWSLINDRNFYFIPKR